MKIFLSSLLLATVTVAADELVVQDAGPNHTVWDRIKIQEDSKGGRKAITNSFVELASGLNYFDPEVAAWVPSQEEFEATADGHWVARRGQHRVILPANLRTEPVDLEMPDGGRMVSSLLGVGLFDARKGAVVVLGEVQDCQGEQIAPGWVVYRGVLTTLDASCVYTYRRGGFEQDVVLWEDIGDVAELGLDPDACFLDVYTELVGLPEAGSVGSSGRLQFGTMRMAQGKAYLAQDEPDAVDIQQHVEEVDGRRILVESVPLRQLQPLLGRLDAKVDAGRRAWMARRPAQDRRSTLARLLPRRTEPGTLLASGTGPMPGRQQGLVLDYSIVNSTVTNFSFLQGATYYVSGPVILGGTNTLFEGGTVIKLTNSTTAKLSINTPITWSASAYRPVVITGADDSSVGEVVGTNALTGYYGDTGLEINASTANADAQIQNLRASSLRTAIKVTGRTNHVLSHIQLVGCQNGIWANNAEFRLRNALLDNVLTNFIGSSATGRCEHLTVDTAAWLNHSLTRLEATNSLLVSVTNAGTYSGAYNSVVASGSGVFQTAGAGRHYLSAGSAYRDAGTTAINSNLLSDLGQMTTFAPVSLSGSILVPTTLGPVVSRDATLPDRGYHYWPLDYLASNVTVQTSLTLTNGVAVGVLGVVGLDLSTGAGLASEGLPQCLNRIVSFPNVQEAPLAYGGGRLTRIAASAPTLSFRFTEMAALPGVVTSSGWSLVDLSSLTLYYTSLSFRDCVLRGGTFGGEPGTTTPVTFSLINNVVDRCTFDLFKNYYSKDAAMSVSVYNNLFRGGALNLIYNSGASNPTWNVRDNLLDRTTQSITGTSTNSVNRWNNAFSVGTANQLGGATNILGVALDYQAGALGGYYYPANGSGLYTLVNAGSQAASLAGLYHHTVFTAQTKEATGRVDIGFHYLALSGGNPVESDGDGAADYVEDRNGNGTVDTGETDWSSASDAGLQVRVTEPKNNSVIP